MTERNEAEIDISTLWRGIQRYLVLILSAALILSLLAYFWARHQPPTYAASATLISSGAQTGLAADSPLNAAVVKAPPLPDGALQQAMQSTLVIEPLIKALSGSAQITGDERTRIVLALNQELRQQRLRTVRLTSRVEQYSAGSGIYTITARAGTPEAAATLANLTAQALLNWDRGRALENIRRAENGFQAQLTQVDQQLRDLGQTSGVEYQTLIARRSSVQASITTVGILANSVTGVLSPLSSAVPPLSPEAPRPTRNAVLVALLTLLFGVALAALRAVLDRTVRNEDDVLTLELPTLAILPKIRQRDIVLNGIVRAARQAGLYEAIGFLRVNLLGTLKLEGHPVIMITSTVPGEGKSSVTATLADGFATSGQRVLVIDADLRRGTQEGLWKKFNESGEWSQLIGRGGVRTTRDALLHPEHVEVLAVQPNVHMLPAGPSLHDSLSVFNQADLTRALGLWRTRYDVILVDSAPLLAIADGLVLGTHVDAVLMVSEYGRTHLQSMRSALRRARRAGLNIVGVVINKADARAEQQYGYAYSYGAKGEQV